MKEPAQLTEAQAHRLTMLATTALRQREAAKVERAHTLPHIGSYPVGLHSANMALLLMLLNPAAKLPLVRACLLHDAPERWLGDVPAPLKWYSAELKDALHAADHRVAVEVFKYDEHALSTEDLQWLKAVDAMEFWMWCIDQLHMGNHTVVHAERHVRHYLRERAEAGEVPWPLPTVIAELAKRAEHPETWRQPDVLPTLHGEAK